MKLHSLNILINLKSNMSKQYKNPAPTVDIIIEISNPDDIKQLMSPEQYEEYLSTLE